MEAKTLTLVERLKDIECVTRMMAEDDQGLLVRAQIMREAISALEAAQKALEPFVRTLSAMEKRAPGYHEGQPNNRALDIEACYGTLRLARTVYHMLKGNDHEG